MLARLTAEFPDLTPSKLRFLEERHLISPARTESGYRKFSPADLERLRFVLTMQRDHYLPLKVIRGYLDDLEVAQVLPFEKGLREYLKTKHADLIKRIEDTKELSKDDEGLLHTALKDFKKSGAY